MSDVVVIGGGPAGALAGMLLARRGWGVTIVEQHAFPRQKVCGECLSALGLEVLRRAGVLELLEQIKPARLTHASLQPMGVTAVRLALGRPMLGISRAALDVTLLECARGAGARVLQPARCESLRSVRGGVEVTARELATNRLVEVRANAGLLADGKGALLKARRPPTTDFGIKAHFRNVDGPRDTIALFGVDGHYGGVAPIEGGLVNAAFSVPGAMLQQYRGDVDALFAAEAVGVNEAIGRQFSRAERVGEWLASPLPRFGIAPAWPGYVIPLGNAAAALEPIGGEGMGLALRSAELAVEALARDPAAVDRPGLRAAFGRLWRVRSATCRMAARVLSHRTLGGVAVELLGVNEGLGRAAMGLMGKGWASKPDHVTVCR